MLITAGQVGSPLDPQQIPPRLRGKNTPRYCSTVALSNTAGVPGYLYYCQVVAGVNFPWVSLYINAVRKVQGVLLLPSGAINPSSLFGFR